MAAAARVCPGGLGEGARMKFWRSVRWAEEAEVREERRADLGVYVGSCMLMDREIGSMIGRCMGGFKLSSCFVLLGREGQRIHISTSLMTLSDDSNGLNQC